jgi:predicted Zn-dependent peptidase
MAGPKIVLLEQGHEPLLRIDIQWNHGSWFESDFLAARTMTRMLTEGTLRRSAAEWTSMVDFWGGSIRFSTEAEQTTATLMVLDRFFPQVWPLFLEAITEPAFGQDALDAVLLSKIQHWHIESRKMSFMAGRQLRQMIYPLGHPEARLSHPDIYRAVTRDHLVRAHRQIMENAEISIAVCGPMGAGIIPGLIEDVQRAFPILSSGNLPKAPMLMDLPIPAPALVHVPQQDALQVSLRAALVWPPKTDREYHLLKILVTVLGGYFGSRLMQNLREDLGLTYGVGARLRSYRNHSLMVVQSELSAGSEKLALEQIRFEMDRLGRELISVPEWGRVQSYLRGQLMAGLDGSFALMDRYWDLESFGLGEDYLKDYLRILDETTPEDLMDLAGKYLLPDQLVVASAGPEA